jgi:hypothetical protein
MFILNDRGDRAWLHPAMSAQASEAPRYWCRAWAGRQHENRPILLEHWPVKVLPVQRISLVNLWPIKEEKIFISKGNRKPSWETWRMGCVSHFPSWSSSEPAAVDSDWGITEIGGNKWISAITKSGSIGDKHPSNWKPIIWVWTNQKVLQEFLSVSQLLITLTKYLR